MLVAVATVLCAIGAHNTLVQLHFSRLIGPRHGLCWGALAAATTNVAVWAAHFVAMLPFDPRGTIGYVLGGTILSLILPVLRGVYPARSS